MKLVAFERSASVGQLESPGWGVIVGEGVVDGRHVLGGEYLDIHDVLVADALERVSDAAGALGPDMALHELRLLPPVQFRGQKIFCVGLNYADHRDEGGAPVAGYPTIFTRFPDSHVGHESDVVRPPRCSQLDFEGELVAVIGKSGFGIGQADAWNHVAGYSCYNDVSARDWQSHTSQWIPGKNFYGVGAFGPALVTADEISDIENVELTVRVNGEQRQAASTKDMLFKIPQLIEYISSFSPLNPGDLIVTGTPAGVGAFAETPVFLEDRDLIEVEISGIGILRNRIIVSEAGETDTRAARSGTAS